MTLDNQLPVDTRSFASSHKCYQGTVIVLASGPSAKDFPIEACPYPIIAVNGSILMFEGLTTRPFFYICDDPKFAIKRPDLLALGIEKAEHVALSRSCFEEAHLRGIDFPKEGNFYLLERASRLSRRPELSVRRFAWSIRNDAELHSDYSLWSRKANTIGFSQNLAKGYFSARTIAYVAVQLACHLGFSRVCLAGVDLNQDAGRGYQERTPLPSTLAKDFPGHILPSFVFMQRHIIKSGKFEVYNLSGMSRLPAQVIPRMTVNELIGHIGLPPQYGRRSGVGLKEKWFMKVMLLVMAEQRVNLDQLYEAVRHNFDSCDVFRLTSFQQKNLGSFFATTNYQSYDRVVLFTRVKRQLSQLAVLRCIPGLVFLEHDACQNYMPDSKYRGAYSKLYRKLPWTRAIVSGFDVARRLRDEGVDAVFVSKGYDERALKDLSIPRDIPAAFLGSLRSRAYSGRKSTLESIAARTDMLLVRTESGAEYLQMLNRIKVFVSADVGMSEYMIKNFEAMACGCILLTWSQGAEENAVIGFKDMENVLLYSSVDEAVEKLRWVNANQDAAQAISVRGRAFVESKYGFSRVAEDIAHAIALPLRSRPGLQVWQRLYLRLRYALKV